jgi:RNA polymerase sigma-70 factor (ECF subfamily)
VKRKGNSATEAPELVQALVSNHHRFLEFLERRLGSRADAEEMLQAAFVRGLKRADTIRDEDRVVPWFYRILRNAIADHYRHRAAEERVLQRLASESEEAAESPELRAAVCACVSELARTLKPEYRTILERVELEEASVADVAREEGISPNNAAVRLHRARQALRRRVMETCGTCAEHGCVDCRCKHGV